jgi:putative tricarboxylic transport membrane protein
MFTVDRVSGVALAAFSALVLWESRKIPFGTLSDPGPGAMPTLLALTLLVCSCAVMLGGSSEQKLRDVEWSEWRNAAAILGTLVFMALAIEGLGYRLTIFSGLFILVSVFEKKSWLASLLFAAGFSLGTFYLFYTLLQVQLPKGPFGI